MKYSKSPYYGTVCRKLWFRRIDFDLDTSGSWRRPGFCLGFSSGPERTVYSPTIVGGWYKVRDGPAGCLDLGAPMGEPNLLYLSARGWSVRLGLLSWHREGPQPGPGGKDVWVRRWSWPHLTSVNGYRCHLDEAGEWAWNPPPAWWHPGWLTVERDTPAS